MNILSIPASNKYNLVLIVFIWNSEFSCSLLVHSRRNIKGLAKEESITVEHASF